MMDGQKLVERGKKNWLLDDYVKFLRKSHLQTLGAGLGCIGLVINNAFLDNPTFRGLRNSLLSDFSKLDFLNLHGSGKRNDAGSAGIVDQNVFEIVQGVCVALLTRNPGRLKSTVPRYSEILATRDQKFAALLTPSQIHPFDAITPRSPDFYFMPGGVHPLEAEYLTAHSLPVVFSLYGNGVITSKDHFAYAFVESDMKNRLTGLLDPNLTDEAAAEQYQINDNSMWSLSEARKRLRKTIDFGNICTALYRPFDHRFTYFDHDVIFNQRLPVTKHIFARENKCLLSTRMTKGEDWQHLFIGTKISDCAALSNSTSTNAFSLPLWVYVGKSKIPNLSPAFLVNLQSALTLTPADYRPEDSTAPLHAEKIFHYLYAILHSPAYRQRYAAFLRTDFPRIPIPGSRKVFDALAKLGAELVAWHLLEHQDAINIVAGGERSTGAVAWFGTDYSLVKVADKSRELADMQGTDDKVGKVFINATSGFANVLQSIWQHTIGGYQVLHKWLDDRRKAGRSLSQDDITHWLRVYAALRATQKLMQQVDAAVEANGGWPGAFSQNHPPPDAATLAAEQMAQKEQLKAQKKAETATKKRSSYASPTGASSLFDDLEDMAGAAGGPDRPKSRATPAKAAGGKASGAAAQVDGLNDGQVMCAIRRVLASAASAGSGGLSRDDLIRSTARELGHARTSPALKVELDSAIRRAVRRGIAENSGGVLTVLVKDIDGYDREHLKAQLLAAIRATGGTCAKSEAPMLLARALGFARTGAGIAAVVESLLRSLVRTKQVEFRAGQIRVIRAGVAV
jgi:hypothetical protein